MLYKSLNFFVFFFQAEDGIRDFHVTGVQTCALPISKRRAAPAPPNGAAERCAWPTRSARCGLESSGRTGGENSPRAASLLPSTNPFAAPSQLGSPRTAVLLSAI